MNRLGLVFLATAIPAVSSAGSLITSKQAELSFSNTGTVYSLPKQNLSITYESKTVSVDKAEADKLKAEKIVKDLKGKKGEIETKIKAIAKEIDALKKESPVNQAAVMEKEKARSFAMADLLLVTEKLVIAKAAAKEAKDIYVLAKHHDKAIIEKVTLKPESVSASDNTYVASFRDSWYSSDSLDISVKNGMLHGDLNTVTDSKLDDAIVSFLGSVSGISGAPIFETYSKFAEIPASKKCEKATNLSLNFVIDPYNVNDWQYLNSHLKKNKTCIYLLPQGYSEIEEKSADGKTLAENVPSIQKPRLPAGPQNGLIYQQPGEFTVSVYECEDDKCKPKLDNKNPPPKTVRTTLAQAGPIGIVDFPASLFAKHEYDVSFSNGALTNNKISKESEIVSAIAIIPNSLKAIIEIPAEILQLKIDFSSKEQSYIETQKAILEAQMNLMEQQKLLENKLAQD